MDNPKNQITSQLPAYIAGAVPNPPDKRAPWYSNTAPTYAGIFLWFVFWQDAVKAGSLGGGLAQNIGLALLSMVISALVCHFLFYLVPGLLGMKTGLPLYIVGTSTFGANGGFIMPGFLMGLLQFGWLGVNIYFAGLALSATIPVPKEILMIIWGVLAAFLGLKGIQYVAKVATFLPLVPFCLLIYLLLQTVGTVGSFSPQVLIDTHKSLAPSAPAALDTIGVLAFMLTYVVGFFATAGAAGVDFGSGSRDKNDVSMGGLMGVAFAIIFTIGISLLVVAGVYGNKEFTAKSVEYAKAAIQTEIKKEQDAAAKKSAILSPEQITKITNDKAAENLLQSTKLMKVITSEKTADWLMFLLALTAFPSACFSSLIAANSFKTTLPGVNPFISVGIGALVSILLALTGLAGQVIPVFVIIGASFGPICGAMMVDYLLAGNKWAGPRAGFNPAGWIAWVLGFLVGILPNFGVNVPAAPVAAFIVGAVIYLLCAKAGLQSPTLPLPDKLVASTK